MTVRTLPETEERVASGHTPFLSHSRVSKYLHCPEQYRLYYVERLRPRIPPAALVFGRVLHEALARLFQGGDPLGHFLSVWSELKAVDIHYSGRDSWEKLSGTGERLLEKFVQEEFSKFGVPEAVERSFELKITSLDVPFVGVIDLIAELEGVRAVIDFKSSSSAYHPFEIVLSDQLTAYQLAEPQIERLALCVLVKTKEPRIDWFLSGRDPAQLMEYLDKADHVVRDITAGRFYKRPGKWCGWCDFLPVCLRDEKKAEEMLVRVP
jgi:CRISPR/Cas system-associated exonuclease Cas4 (RecB family)